MDRIGSPQLDRSHRTRDRRQPVLAALLLVEATLALLGTRLLVRLRLRPAAGWALRAPTPALTAAPASLQLRIARALSRAAVLLPGSLCLARAMAGKWMLERRGFRATIHLGVAHRADAPGSAPTLAAHAWLEAGGPILTGRDAVAIFTPVRGTGV